jgi:hypothetical protein
MMRVWQKQLRPGVLGWPVTGWEFHGVTTVVVMQGWLEVGEQGVYHVSAASVDAFLVYLEGKWVYFEESATAGNWSTAVEFTLPGKKEEGGEGNGGRGGGVL